MQLFDNLNKKIDRPKEQPLHHKYELLNGIDGSWFNHIIEQWADGFEDRDGKVLTEFQTTFHSTFWEFYIFQLLKDMGLKEFVDFSKNRPDFIVWDENKRKHRFYIEAVVANIKQDGRPETERNDDDLEQTSRPVWKLNNFEEIINEGIIRCSNAIQSKLKKYNDYLKLDWINAETPYIVGLSSFGQVNYGNECHYSIMALLYGAYLNENGVSYSHRDKITKSNGSPIDLGIFYKKENDNFIYENISAVLFSSKVTLGKVTALAISQGAPNITRNLIINIYQDDEPPYFKGAIIPEHTVEHLTDGLFIFHNPNAKNKLDLNIFRNYGIVQFYDEGQGLVGEKINNDGNGTPPLICKINRAMLGVNESIKKMILSELIDDFNG